MLHGRRSLIAIYERHIRFDAACRSDAGGGDAPLLARAPIICRFSRSRLRSTRVSWPTPIPARAAFGVSKMQHYSRITGYRPKLIGARRAHARERGRVVAWKSAADEAGCSAGGGLTPVIILSA